MMSAAYLDGRNPLTNVFGRHHDAVAAAVDRERHHRARLAPREARFVDDLRRNYHSLTDKQAKWLYATEVRLREARQ